MKDFIKTIFAEAFEGCTPLNIVKRVIAMILVMFNLILFCGADSIGGFPIAVSVAVSAVIWKFCNLSDAFPEE